MIKPEELVKEFPKLRKENYKILDLITVCGALNTTKIANYVDKTRRAVILILNDMLSREKIIQIGQNVNDPTKRYIVKDGKEIRERSIKNIVWEVEWDYQTIILSIKLRSFEIDFYIIEEVIEDNILNYTSGDRKRWRKKALAAIKNKYINEAELFIPLALLDAKEELFKSIEKRKPAQIDILQEHFVQYYILSSTS